MTKGRKTTKEERAEIVAFCIGHGKDYGLTVQTYQVSYQQIYSWVKKYEQKGYAEFADPEEAATLMEEAGKNSVSCTDSKKNQKIEKIKA